MLFDFPEIVIICGVALVVLGPKKLPATAAKIGRWVGRARSMARQFKEQLELEVNSVDTALDTKPVSQPTIHQPGAAGPANPPVNTTIAPAPTTAPSQTAGHEDFAAGLAATGMAWPPESPAAPREPATAAAPSVPAPSVPAPAAPAPAAPAHRSDNHGDEAAATNVSDVTHR
jgi:sec-independent protein translocase protein TatB